MNTHGDTQNIFTKSPLKDFRDGKDTELHVVGMLNRLLSHLFLLVAELLQSNTQARGDKKERTQ